MDFLTLKEVTKTYERGLVQALRGVTLSIGKGEAVALMGSSGCGKSTLLGLIGALDRVSGGAILVEGRNINELLPWHSFRARKIGFVFQFHHLISSMTLFENVETPMIALGIEKVERRRRAWELLERVGLRNRVDCFPNRVSGGERQRAAVVRAMINRPALLLADEPTGNLDSAMGEALIDLLLSQARDAASTVLMATHNPEVAARCDRRILMKDGRIVGG